MASTQDGSKPKTATRQEVTDWIVSAWQVMKERRERFRRSFQVCAPIESSPTVVRKDDVVRQALDKVLKELQDDNEDFDCEDPFADIVPEQGNDSSPLEITD